MPDRALDCRLERLEVEAWISELESIPAARDWTVEDVLEAAGSGRRIELARLLSAKAGADPAPRWLADELGRVGGHTAANIWRGLRSGKGWRSVGVGYEEVVRDVASSQQILVRADEPVASIEERLIRKAFVKLLEGMSPEDRKAFVERIETEAKLHGKNFGAEAAAGAALIAAEASGFGVYMMATTLLGAVSKGLGLGFGFGAYVGLVQALSVLMPASLVGLGLWTAYKVGAPNMKRTVPAVLLIAATRLELAEAQREALRALRERQAKLDEREKALGRVAEPTIDMRVPAATPGWRPRWIVAAIAVVVFVAVALIAFWLWRQVRCS
jgi:uncharacterized protein YaaW (UPF0174 family)